MIEVAKFLIYIGIGISFFFATLLLSSKKYQQYPNQFLAFALVTFALVILQASAVVSFPLLAEVFEFLRIEYLPPVFLYLFVRLKLRQTVSRSTKLLLLSPFLFFSFLHTLVSLADWWNYHTLGAIGELIEPFEFYSALGFFIIMCALSLRELSRQEKRQGISNWLEANWIAIILLACCLLTGELLEGVFGPVYWQLLWMLAAAVIIRLSYTGIQELVLDRSPKKYRINTGDTQTAISVSSCALHFANIQRLMQEQQLFKDPGLNRDTLAKNIGVSPSTITRVLKEQAGLRFNEFVEQYRVALAKDMLVDQRFQLYSLEAIGKEVGFRSRSNFYASFKKSTDLTPGAYKEKEGFVLDTRIRSNTGHAAPLGI
ncbi:MAG: helix-turn-helix transcriptional regulator [Bacteroidota bacterium]